MISYRIANRNLPREALRSVRHTTPSVDPRFREGKTTSEKAGRRRNKPRQEEQQRSDPSARMDGRAVDIVCAGQISEESR